MITLGVNAAFHDSAAALVIGRQRDARALGAVVLRQTLADEQAGLQAVGHVVHVGQGEAAARGAEVVRVEGQLPGGERRRQDRRHRRALHLREARQAAGADAIVGWFQGAMEFEPRAPVLPQEFLADWFGPAQANGDQSPFIWRLARGPIVAFTDDDMVPEPDWLREGWRALVEHPDWVAAAGRVVVPPLRPGLPPTDHERMTRGLERADFVTANAFVRRCALVRVNGFDQRFRRAWREDSDLDFRLLALAGPVGRAPLATVLHPVRAEPWGVSLRQQRNALFEALLYKKRPVLYRETIRPSPELLLASLAIPFLCVFWRLRGAWRSKAWFL